MKEKEAEGEFENLPNINQHLNKSACAVRPAANITAVKKANQSEQGRAEGSREVREVCNIRYRGEWKDYRMKLRV